MSSPRNAVIWVAAAMLTGAAIGIPLAGRLVGWRDVWVWTTGWWTPGWGNLFTVVVALAAVGVSAAFNIATLRRSVAQHRQVRTDATTDKLRNELVEYFTGIERCRTAARKLGGQLQEITAATLRDLKGDNDPEVMKAYRSRAYAAYSETLPEAQLRLAANEFKLMLLTTDREILTRTGKISGLLNEDAKDFEVLVRADREDFAEHMKSYSGTTLLDRHEKRHSEIYEQFLELGLYCVKQFAMKAD